MTRRIYVLAAALLFWAVGAQAQGGGDRNTALDYLGRGTAAFRVGDMVAATQNWSRAIEMCRLIGAPDLEAQALVRRGEAYRVEGHFRDADTDLRAALAKAEQSGDRALIAASSGALGNLALLSRRSAVAEPLLQRSRDTARTLPDRGILAAAANDIGNLYAATDRADQAAAAYDEAIAAADAAHDEALAATAETNAARLAMRRNSAAAAGYLSRAVARLERLTPSYAGGLALISAGSVVFERDGAPSAENQRLAYAAFQKAAAIGEGSKNAILTSLALGNLGRLYERSGQFAEATAMTQRALFAAQQTGAPELLFRWEWQNARLARSQGQVDAALAGYRRAVTDLRQVRQDIPVEYRSGRSSYLTTYGPVYLEFADLLLRRSAAEPARSTALMREARDTVEALKESELQDFFRDSCVTSFEAKRRSIDAVAAGTAVLYPIVLADRLELLVSFGQEQRQFTIALPEARLREEVQQFRIFLEKRTTNEFLSLAQTLYGQIIRPIEPLLSANRIGTLVIVPDNVLRLIPFGTLHDGDHFLIERYATAIAPSLHLIDPKPLTSENRDALVLGLSQAVGGYAGLPNVKREVAQVQEINGGKSLIDEQFSRVRFEGELKGSPYNIVHIASHGEFGSDPSKTFVLTFDGKLMMDDLERTIKYGELRASALELLTLDACQTASGDDRAALGLAGIALKSGARSALATLWFISDRASGELAVHFYRALKAGGVSKAQALQTAQRELIEDPRFAHPAYWAPFLLIGNWL
jgi:CHAT domain-containing protein